MGVFSSDNSPILSEIMDRIGQQGIKNWQKRT
jgi:hypothetical protein